MLVTYQAKWVNNEIHWIDEPPQSNRELTLAITVLPSSTHETPKPKRQIPASLKGRGKTNDDIVDTSDFIAPKPKRTPPPELKGMMTFDDDIWGTSEMFAEWEYFK